eukprot:TRINITY_DN2814_c3_g1_i1.p1 TRINITY_DN2814_c3_g1~~TRINITY_DN2814_c3_g1_i1.p1  ORF type:complete len:850 (+),score=155.50 TRINITY_DN2814_c3_g1_i1:65-2551(+)
MPHTSQQIAVSLKERMPPLVPGDQVVLEYRTGDVDNCPCLLTGRENSARPVGLIVTLYTVIVIFHDERYDNIEIPIMCIDEVREPKKIPRMAEEVVIVNKLPWDLRIGFHTRRESAGLYNAVMFTKKSLGQNLPGQPPPLERLFAFDHARRYKEKYKNTENGWDIYNIENELDRQTRAGSVKDQEGSEWAGKGIGICLRPWFRIAHIDKDDEGFSPTYPSRFVVPRNATDKLIKTVAGYRSRARVPMVSWVSVKTGAILARSSQPLAGYSNSRSHADEVVCETLLAQAYIPGGTPIPACFHDDAPDTSSSPSSSPRVPVSGRPPPSLAALPPSLTAPPSLSASSHRRSDPTPSVNEITAMKQQQEKHKRPYTVIFDARSQIAATANRARGGGFETSKNYNCKLYFLHMENIHAVKASWKKCKKLIEGFNNNLSNLKDQVPGPQGPNTGFYADWDKTGWSLHVQRLLYGSSRIVDEMLAGASCLVHCSDGWDRTSQLTSTAMLLIDPYFRTIRGFCTLIEKEWCVTGHKFAERSGHQIEGTMAASKFKEGLGNEMDETTVDSKGIEKHTKTGSGIEPSPVFLQWMDAIFQLIRQFPTAFEFTPALLEFIMDCVYSCRFGTFICNFDKERIGEGVKENTISVWTEVLRLTEEEKKPGKKRNFISKYYQPVQRGQSFVLRPSCSSKRVVLWESYYLKHDVELTQLRQYPFVSHLRASAGNDSDSSEEEDPEHSFIRQQLSPEDSAEALPAPVDESQQVKELRDQLEDAHTEITRLHNLMKGERERKAPTSKEVNPSGEKPVLKAEALASVPPPLPKMHVDPKGFEIERGSV